MGLACWSGRRGTFTCAFARAPVPYLLLDLFIGGLLGWQCHVDHPDRISAVLEGGTNLPAFFYETSVSTPSSLSTLGMMARSDLG